MSPIYLHVYSLSLLLGCAPTSERAAQRWRRRAAGRRGHPAPNPPCSSQEEQEPLWGRGVLPKWEWVFQAGFASSPCLQPGACGWHQRGSASALLPPTLVAFLHFLIARAQRTPSVVALTVGLAQVAKSPECLSCCLRVPL